MAPLYANVGFCQSPALPGVTLSSRARSLLSPQDDAAAARYRRDVGIERFPDGRGGAVGSLQRLTGCRIEDQQKGARFGIGIAGVRAVEERKIEPPVM